METTEGKISRPPGDPLEGEALTEGGLPGGRASRRALEPESLSMEGEAPAEPKNPRFQGCAEAQPSVNA